MDRNMQLQLLRNLQKNMDLFTRQAVQGTHKLTVQLSVRSKHAVKQLLTKNQDPYLAMLAYRSTPLENGYSPAELLMGRKLCTTLPISKEQLQPNLPNTEKLRKKEREMRHRMKRNFDRRCSAKNLKPLSPGDTVWIPEREAGGTVERESGTRSYTVQTEDGTL